MRCKAHWGACEWCGSGQHDYWNCPEILEFDKVAAEQERKLYVKIKATADLLAGIGVEV